MASNTLWVDFTASYNWRRAPAGITRVEQECCRWVLKNAPEKVRFCVYDTSIHRWFEMPLEQAWAVLNRRYRADGSIEPDTLSSWKPTGRAVAFAAGERYICLSADHTAERWAGLYRARQQVGLRVFSIVHDLIPILFPHFYGKDIDQSAARYLVDMAWVSEHIVCISQRTRADLLAFYAQVGVQAPPTSLVRLGDELPVQAGHAPSGAVAALAAQPYILTVGTLEPRKNHETLYRALLHLLGRGVRDLPRLVFAGMRGWRVDDLLLSLELDPRVQERIQIVAHASDADIATLYRNCLFTVFPSVYEGWGLPVAESLAHGKFCLASTGGAVPEIAPELTENLDPYDVRAWAERMLVYSRDADLRQQREAAIAAQYQLTPWAQTAQGVMSRALQA